MNIIGEITRTIKANIQLATNAITKPAVTFVILSTIKAKASPTRLFTVEASVDNRAPIAPLDKMNDETIFIFGSSNKKKSGKF